MTDTTPRFRWTVEQGGTTYELIVTRSNGVEEFRKTYQTKICANGVCEVTPGRTWDLDTYNWQVRVYTHSGSTLGPVATFTIN